MYKAMPYTVKRNGKFDINYVLQRNCRNFSANSLIYLKGINMYVENTEFVLKFKQIF